MVDCVPSAYVWEGTMSSSPSKRSVRRTRSAAKPSAKSSKLVYQLKVSLNGAKPPIWRRVQVRASTTLSDLHHIIASAMGWMNSHLHEFEVDGDRYAAPNEFYPEEDPDVIDARTVRLGDLVPVGAKFTYTYDFGDDWRHDILVEKELQAEPGVSLPRCVGGRRGCPPEDVGGVWGYAEFLEVWRDPSHPEHEELREWAGPYFDPETFDPDEVTRYLSNTVGIDDTKAD